MASRSFRGAREAHSGLLSLSVNQDATCVVAGTPQGLSIFNLQTGALIYSGAVGALGIVEMLFSTSLVAYVGAGEQPSLTPRKLALASTAGAGAGACAPIRDVPFVSAVLSARLNRAHVVAVLEREAHVLELRTLAPRPPGPLPTPRNPLGLAALSPGEGQPLQGAGRCLLALPAHERRGAVRVYDLGGGGGGGAGAGAGGGAQAAADQQQQQQAVGVLCDIEAHSAPLAALAFSPCGGLLATASSTGTVVRVHRMPGGGGGGAGGAKGGAGIVAGKPLSLRRGTVPAAVHSLAFSCGAGGGGGGEEDGGSDGAAAAAAEPEVLAVASGHGSIHLFRLWKEEDGGGSSEGMARAGGGGGGAQSSSAAVKAGGRAARTLAAAAGGVLAAAATRWRAGGGGGAAAAAAAPTPAEGGGTGGGGGGAAAAAAAAASVADAAAARRPALTFRLPAEAAGAPCVVGVRACAGPGGRDGEAAAGAGELDVDLLREAALEEEEEQEEAEKDEGRDGAGAGARRGRRRRRRVRPGQQYRVCVASARGVLHVYRIEGLHDPRAAAPKAVLIGVHSLVGQQHQQ